MALVDRYSAWNKAYKLGKFAPQPAQKPRPAAGRPMSPMEKLMAELAAGPRERSEQEWASELDPRVKPFTDAIDASTLNARARSEFQYENASRANKDMGSAFLGILTGGKTGAEAEAYSKSEFGGSYLGGQAMEMAAQNLRVLTSDWDEREWAISGDYLKAMQEIPGIREELRASIEKDDLDDYTRKFQYTTLLLDETYRQSQLAEEKRQFGVTSAETKRVNDAQLRQADAALGIDSYKAGTSRINAGTSAKNAATRAAQAELNKAREARQGLKDKASIRQADARIKIAQDKLALEKRKASGKGSSAQKAETDLALDILKDRDTILGKPTKDAWGDSKSSGMSYTEAYDYVYGLAVAQMGSYRSNAYIANWVKARLRALGLGGGAKAAKPRRG
jgi:hypothetical protein